MKVLKKLLIGVLCGAICLVGAACGKTPGTEPDDGPIGDVDENKQITLRIESAAPLKSNYQALLRSEEEGTQLYNQALFTKRLVDGFKTKYPNVKLQFIEDGWGDALFQAQQLYIRDYNAGGKMAVDIMIGETYMGYFAENGVFAELEAEKFSDVIEGACADVTIDGKLYGVPMCTGIMGLQYNTTILTEAGIAEEDWVPSTWDELLENCRIAYTAKLFAVVPGRRGEKAAPARTARGIANEFYELYQEEAALVLRDKRTGEIYRNPVLFEDSADKGDAYVYRVSPEKGRMGAEYSAGRDGADCYVRGKFFRNGLICHADSFDSKKYSGGRFAVQTAELERLYYLKDKYAECRLSPESLFTCDCPSVVVTCRKKGEKGGTLLRFVNLSDKVQNAEFAFRGKMYVTNMSEREETCAGEKCARLTFSPKQIITVRFTDV